MVKEVPSFLKLIEVSSNEGEMELDEDEEKPEVGVAISPAPDEYPFYPIRKSG